MTARVHLVGAGPGDPGLITLRGIECLRAADLVLYDYLVNPQVLQHAPQAECVCLGKHGRDRILTQEEINAQMIAAAQAGRTVVRLKGGDPVVFGRLAEELAALNAAAVPYEIVPGITAALAVGSYCEVPLTHRDAASAVALVTGQEQEGKEQPGVDYQALAAFPGTLVFYMGVTTAGHWSQSLIAAGKPADTPALLVRRCSWPDQVSFSCTLAAVAATVIEKKLRPPVLTIVGSVAAQAAAASWFVSLPLFGRRILVTRPQEQAGELVSRLQQLGADCPVQPAIEIGPPASWKAVDQVIARLQGFDWLVFSSANGVRFFLNRLLESGGDLRRLARVRLAAIGPGTAEELAGYHLRPDLVPEEFRAEALAEALSEQAAGQRFLLIRASRGREVLAESLTAAGGQVTQVVAYASLDVPAPLPENAQLLAAGRVDWVTVTSSAIARGLVRMFGDNLKKSRLVSISPITSATLAELGYAAAAEATVYTMQGVVDAILRAEGKLG